MIQNKRKSSKIQQLKKIVEKKKTEKHKSQNFLDKGSRNE